MNQHATKYPRSAVSTGETCLGKIVIDGDASRNFGCDGPWRLDRAVSGNASFAAKREFP
jgi:hypothetical protein